MNPRPPIFDADRNQELAIDRSADGLSANSQTPIQTGKAVSAPKVMKGRKEFGLFVFGGFSTIAAVAPEPPCLVIHRRRRSRFGHDRDLLMTSPRTIKSAKNILCFLAPVVLSLLCSSTTLLVA